MTDEERKNRNPPVEVVVTTWGEIEACRELHCMDLEPQRVYILQGKAHVATLNYAGQGVVVDPHGDPVTIHRFYGPRAGVFVYLRERPDGTVEDGEGTKITLREYTGEDA